MPITTTIDNIMIFEANDIQSEDWFYAKSYQSSIFGTI
jgi:hypothetical protein